MTLALVLGPLSVPLVLLLTRLLATADEDAARCAARVDAERPAHRNGRYLLDSPKLSTGEPCCRVAPWRSRLHEAAVVVVVQLVRSPVRRLGAACPVDVSCDFGARG